MIRAAFAPHDPLRAHAALGPAAYAIICESLIAAPRRPLDWFARIDDETPLSALYET